MPAALFRLEAGSHTQRRTSLLVVHQQPKKERPLRESETALAWLVSSGSSVYPKAVAISPAIPKTTDVQNARLIQRRYLNGIAITVMATV
jgi:hypothetical protein